ncbi:MAG: hypothetical protein WAX14_08345 [Rhodococcus sp. (in: high G+C Gram-positive bacteria)]|uniref:hypothetical protein n=1 Tax=Rhodococcus sp. TaxID=1831 RepID=UPI003BB4FDDC
MTDRAQTVTDIIANYIANEGDMDDGKRISERATEFATAGNVDGLAEYVTHTVRSHASGFTAEVRNELAENDWERIDWNEVAYQLRD